MITRQNTLHMSIFPLILHPKSLVSVIGQVDRTSGNFLSFSDQTAFVFNHARSNNVTAITYQH